MPWHDEDTDEGLIDEGVDEADLGPDPDDDTDDDALMMCPSCRRRIHEDTQCCPYCGDWITPVYPSSPMRHWLWVAVVVLLIMSLLGWTIF